MILIGGSAGAFESILSILNKLDSSVLIPIIVILHRSRNSISYLEQNLQTHTHYKVKEAENNEFVKKGYLYTAPSDYHLLLENNGSLSLDASEEVQYSRPSIDVSFESFSRVLKQNCLGILLSGSNKDGAFGLKIIAQNNGQTIVQNPYETDFKRMPKAAIDFYNGHQVLKINEIITKINQYAK
ncbi:MAG: two-component system, chemotaxis family, protein-glutamate methylesterase/glutaminase [Bacteroidota bacterium]|nr:two-component system, chemotaxis family, protein-glutamate methylesterase/glutaminase [Bacteroidota bacterium]